MTTDLRAVLAALLTTLAAGCGSSEPRGFGVVAGVNGADRSLARACELTERRCTRCHPIDRVLNAHVTGPADWGAYVTRMRRNPGSGIRVEEEPTLVRCLVHHSFGSQESP